MVAWPWRSAGVALLAVASVAVAPPVAAQDWECDAPTLALEPARAEAGAEVVITGGGFMSACRDWLICEDWGCVVVPPEPESAVELAFEQDGRRQVIATAHPAGSDPEPPADGYAFAVRAAVPADARPGPASIVAVPAAGAWWEAVAVPFDVLPAASQPARPAEPAAPSAPSAPARPAAPVRELPATGLDLVVLPLAVGAVLLVVGAVLVGTTRAQERRAA